MTGEKKKVCIPNQSFADQQAKCLPGLYQNDEGTASLLEWFHEVVQARLKLNELRNFSKSVCVLDLGGIQFHGCIRQIAQALGISLQKKESDERGEHYCKLWFNYMEIEICEIEISEVGVSKDGLHTG